MGRERNFKRSARRQPTGCRELSQPKGSAVRPNPKETKFQNNIKFKNRFVHKLFELSPAVTDTNHSEVALLETAASDPEKDDEMCFLWLNQCKTYFPFFQGGRRANVFTSA